LAAFFASSALSLAPSQPTTENDKPKISAKIPNFFISKLLKTVIKLIVFIDN